MASNRAAVLFCALSLAACHSACGDYVFVSGYVWTQSGGDELWDEYIEQSGSPQLQFGSSHGTMNAFVQGYGLRGAWGVYSKTTATGTAQYRGAMAVSNISVLVTDTVTPTLAPGINVDAIAYTQQFHIGGASIGSGTSPGTFLASTYFHVKHNNISMMYGEETLTETGFLTTMPRGNLSWTAGVTPNVPFQLSIEMVAGSYAMTVEDAGTATAEADFSNTFRWGEVIDVRNAITGEAIDPRDFHLYGENGFDWAHPFFAIPEPSSFGLAILSLLWLPLNRRRFR